MRTAGRFFVATCLVVMLAGLSANAGDLDSLYASGLLKPGTEAPDFTLQTAEGTPVTLSDMRGSYVVLEFSASWCPDCRRVAGRMDTLSVSAEGKNVRFVNVSFDDNKEKWVGYMQKRHAAQPTRFVEVSELKKWTAISPLYHIDWIPTMYLIDPEGKIVFGTVIAEKLERAVAEL